MHNRDEDRKKTYQQEAAQRSRHYHAGSVDSSRSRVIKKKNCGRRLWTPRITNKTFCCRSLTGCSFTDWMTEAEHGTWKFLADKSSWAMTSGMFHVDGRYFDVLLVIWRDFGTCIGTSRTRSSLRGSRFKNLSQRVRVAKDATWSSKTVPTPASVLHTIRTATVVRAFCCEPQIVTAWHAPEHRLFQKQSFRYNARVS